MAKEIERKFLVLNDDWRSNASAGTFFRQAYVASMEDRSVRVRLMDGEKATLTLKIGQTALTRDEFEYRIPVLDAEAMLANAIGIVLEKTRYTLTYQGYLWEIDVYDGAYRGLVIAEVELRDEADQPALPSWLGPEVTGDRRYSNQSMATEDRRLELVHGLSH